MSKRVKKNDDGSYTIELKKPIDHAKKVIDKIHLRGETTVADLEEMDAAKGEVQKTARLIAHLSGLSLAAVRKLEGSDYMACAKAVSEILDGGEEDEDEAGNE